MSVDSIIQPRSGARKPPVTVEYVLASPGAKREGIKSKADAAKIVAAYEAGTAGVKAAMRKRLEDTAERIAQDAAKTRAPKAKTAAKPRKRAAKKTATKS